MELPDPSRAVQPVPTAHIAEVVDNDSEPDAKAGIFQHDVNADKYPDFARGFIGRSPIQVEFGGYFQMVHFKLVCLYPYPLFVYIGSRPR